MDNKEENTKQSFLNDYNFLQDDDFIRWRLFQTIELDEYWDDFLKKNPLQEESLKRAITQFNEVMKLNRYQFPEDDKNYIYRFILLKLHRYKRRRLFLRISSAVAVLIIGFLSILTIIQKEDKGLGDNSEREFIVGQTLPEEDIYLISRGVRFNIAYQCHITVTKNGKILVSDSTGKQRELLLGTTEFNKLVVPYGKQTSLTLSDGTEVWLNSGTQLDFPSKFSRNKRGIRVNGEIFLKVAQNPRIPFVVNAKDMDIHVHGTSFNVSSYNDDSKKTVVLVEGKVKIEIDGKHVSELLPNEKIEFVGNAMTKETVNVSEYICWTKGILEFKEAPVSEILKKIGRYYNVQFESIPDIKLNDKICSGKLFLSSNLDSVMTSVSVISSTVYKRENNIIHITKK